MSVRLAIPLLCQEGSGAPQFIHTSYDRALLPEINGISAVIDRAYRRKAEFNLLPADDLQHIRIVIGPGLDTVRLFDGGPIHIVLEGTEISGMPCGDHIV